MGLSIRKCAEILKINIATSFYWRHKILSALKKFIGVGSVEGVKSKSFLIHSTSHFVKSKISNFKTLKPNFI